MSTDLGTGWRSLHGDDEHVHDDGDGNEEDGIDGDDGDDSNGCPVNGVCGVGNCDSDDDDEYRNNDDDDDDDDDEGDCGDNPW